MKRIYGNTGHEIYNKELKEDFTKYFYYLFIFSNLDISRTLACHHWTLDSSIGTSL